MMRISRILRDYAEAGAVNAQIALWGFVTDEVFLTKSGHVGLVYRIRGLDAEALTHEQRRQVVHQVEAALRLLDEHCREKSELQTRSSVQMPGSTFSPRFRSGRFGAYWYGSSRECTSEVCTSTIRTSWPRRSSGSRV